MTSVERAGLVAGASRAVRVLALAGVSARYPAASERMVIARFAEITLGGALALRVHPELAATVGRAAE